MFLYTALCSALEFVVDIRQKNSGQHLQVSVQDVHELGQQTFEPLLNKLAIKFELPYRIW